MALQLFNTLTRRVETFEPLDPAGREVRMYCCGPTVYDYGHIGNFRTFVFADLVRRFLEFQGYTVRHIMNITDVEDKIIRRVNEAKEPLKEYTARYERAFMEDLRALGCLEPHGTPRATEHMPQIIELIRRLLDRGLAYSTSDGSVYFSIEKYRASGRVYGQLLHLNLDGMRPGERVQHDEYDKESVADFALWKARTSEDGAVFWPSPWGEGRPGWHIECSAMSMDQLGPSFDLHLGGEDLVFPHHEDEIAQSEGSGMQEPGRRFVRYWLHGAHLLVDGKKMSKSLGNYFTLRDLLNKGYQGREIRYLLLKAHYRDSLNFTMEGLNEARASLARLDECVGKLVEAAGATEAEAGPGLVEPFVNALEDDFNISAARAAVFDWVRDLNRDMAERPIEARRAAEQLAAWHRVNRVLGLGTGGGGDPVPTEVLEKVHARLAARQARDFGLADRLRQEVLDMGWVIEDTPKGPKLKRG